jgi:hypothetical protein
MAAQPAVARPAVAIASIRLAVWLWGSDAGVCSPWP